MSPPFSRRGFIAFSLSVAVSQTSTAAPDAKPVLIGVVSTGHIDPKVYSFLESQIRSSVLRPGERLTLKSSEASFEKGTLEMQIDAILSMHPDLLVCLDLFAAITCKARRTDKGLPIVFMARADPLAANLIHSYSQPGNNITGITTYRCIDEKMVEIMAEAFPKKKRLGYLIDTSVDDRNCLQLAEATAARLRTDLIKIDVSPVNFVANLGAQLRSLQLQGLIVPATAPLWQNRKVAVAAINGERLPAIYESSVFLDEGGLMYYGPTESDTLPQLMNAIRKIRQGEAAGEIPVEQPTLFELVINLKAPHVTEFAIKSSTLRRADRILE